MNQRYEIPPTAEGIAALPEIVEPGDTVLLVIRHITARTSVVDALLVDPRRNHKVYSIAGHLGRACGIPMYKGLAYGLAFPVLEQYPYHDAPNVLSARVNAILGQTKPGSNPVTFNWI